MKQYWMFFIAFISFLAQAQDHKQLADNYYSLGNYNKAIYHLYQLPESKVQQLKLAKSYEHIGNLKSATAYYDLLYTEYPDDVFIAFDYAKLLIKTSKNTQAQNILMSLLEIDSLNPNFPYQLGLLKEQQKDTLAQHFFKRAFTLDNQFFPAALKVASEKIRLRKFKEAANILDAIIEIDNTHFQAWNLKALNHFYEQDYHKAIEAYSKLIELNRPSENVHQKLGYSYLRTMRPEKALEHYTIAINEFDDKNPQTHLEISQVFMALREFEKAERHIQIAMFLKEPQLEQEYITLFDIYNHQRDYRKAFETIKEATQAYPENEFFAYHYAVTADNYFKDKSQVLILYENYMKKFGTTGRYRLHASQRISDLKKEIHLTQD